MGVRIAGIAAGIALFAPLVAHAGMPFITFSDLAQARIQTISFFALVIGLVGFGVQRLWNRLGRDFERLPRLSYRGALALVLLWGLAMHLVLAMISGARELMTPGAWERRGATYQLRSATQATRDEQLEVARRQQLERLRQALWRFAEDHDGRFPADAYSGGVPEAVWQVIDPSALRYVYVTGSGVDTPRMPLAFEPGIYGRTRLVLFTDGAIETLPLEGIRAAMPGDPAGAQ